MTLDDRIKELQEKTKHLSALLEAPEPGLSAWSTAVGKALASLAEHAPEAPTWSPEKEAIRQKFLQALPHFRFAMKEAAKKGQVMIGILSVKPDESGKVEAQFRADEFFEDIAKLLDAPAQTKETELDAAATKLAQGIRRGLVDLG